MRNEIKELLKGQEERRAEYEKGFNVERVSLAEKFIAELRESLVELECEYLLDNVDTNKVDTSKLEAKLLKANNEINALKEKCKEIGPLKAQATKAIKAKEKKEEEILKLRKELDKITTERNGFKKSSATWQSKHDELAKSQNSSDDDVLREAIKAKDKYIAELESQLQDKAYQAANDGYVVDGLEVSVNIVKDLNDQINKLQEELAQKERDIELLQQAAICYENTKQQNKIENTKEVINEMPKDESNKEYFELNTNVKFKAGTKLYESNNHYVISKPSVKDIVVVPKKFNVEVDKQDFVKYEDLLVNKFNYNKERQLISPVTVEYSDSTHKGFLARTEAKENSLYTFSHKDVLAGYVVNNYKVYSWSWNPETHTSPYVIDLGQCANGKRFTVSPCDTKALIKVIEAMKEQYEKKAKAYCEANSNLKYVGKEEAARSANNARSRINSLLGYQEETDRIAASAQKPQTVVEDNNKEVANTKEDVKASSNNNLSASMNDFVSEMFC